MDKVKILRDLEYLNGSISVLKAINKDREEKLYQLLDEWQDIICIMIDEVDENAEDA